MDFFTTKVNYTPAWGTFRLWQIPIGGRSLIIYIERNPGPSDAQNNGVGEKGNRTKNVRM
jgi:hypothetical protein